MLGQEPARRTLAQLLRRQAQVAAGLHEQSHGAIAFGPTGAGKTMLCRAMCGISGLAFADVNATQYTDKGYIGADLSQIFLSLIQAALRAETADRAAKGKKQRRQRPDSILKTADELLEPAVKRAEVGIVLLDEFDKWMISDAHDPAGANKQRQGAINASESRNVGKKLQAELLKIVEGGEVWVSDAEDELGIAFDTTRVLIICAGAFVDLERIMSRRLGRDLKGQPELWEQSIPRDFEEYGILPELTGRLSTHISFKPLREETMIALMAEEGGVLDEYRRRFAMEDTELRMDEAGELMVAKSALQLGIGARGLRHTMERVFRTALYDAGAHHGRGVVLLDAQAAQSKKASYRPL